MKYVGPETDEVAYNTRKGSIRGKVQGAREKTSMIERREAKEVKEKGGWMKKTETGKEGVVKSVWKVVNMESVLNGWVEAKGNEAKGEGLKEIEPE